MIICDYENSKGIRKSYKPFVNYHISTKEYAEKLSNLEIEMAKAKAIEDEDLYTELKEEREALMNEYAEKRGAI